MRSEFKSGAVETRPSAWRAIFLGGLVAGVLDLAYAVVVYSPRHPELIPQTIATGVLGAKSYEGGMPTVILGTILHFVIAFGAACVLYMASRYLPFIVRHVVVSGIVFGSCVYLFMHFVVIPLSLVPRHTPSLRSAIFEFIEHWFFVGMPIVFFAKRYAGDGLASLRPEARDNSSFSQRAQRE